MRLTAKTIETLGITEEQITKRLERLTALNIEECKKAEDQYLQLFEEYTFSNCGDRVTHKDLILCMLDKYDHELHNIAKKQAGKVYTVCSHEDVFQYAILKILTKPEIINFKYFFATFKNLCLDAIKTEVRRYRKFKVTSMGSSSYQMLNVCTKATLPSYKKVEYDDFTRTLTDSEKEVFYMHFVQKLTMKEIDEKLNKRCDRLLEKVKQAYLLYLQLGFTTISLPDTTEHNYITVDDTDIKPLKYTSKEYNKQIDRMLDNEANFTGFLNTLDAINYDLIQCK